MPDVARSAMEGAFGSDFGRVRIHDGQQAADLNSQIQAKAFTVGNDVFFRDGMPDTSSSGGAELMAHELTHVVQRGTAVRRRGDEVIRRRVAIGKDYQPPNQPYSEAAGALVDDQPMRRFLNQRELEEFAADERRVDHVGLVGGSDWVRVDEFTVLGEVHSNHVAGRIIDGLRTDRFRYEGFSHRSPVTMEASEEVRDLAKEREQERVSKLGLSARAIDTRTHEAEHILPKFARLLPDVIAIAAQQAEKKGDQFVAAGTSWADDYSPTKTITRNLLDALVYVRGHAARKRKHDLKTFYSEHQAEIDESIAILRTSEDAKSVPNLAELPARACLAQLADVYSALAKQKLGLKKPRDVETFKGSLYVEGDPDVDDNKKQPTDRVEDNVAITDEAKEADYLRDRSMFEMMKKSYKARDLLFVIGDAHRKKLTPLVRGQGWRIVNDEAYLEGERKLNQEAVDAHQGLDREQRMTLDQLRNDRVEFEQQLNDRVGRLDQLAKRPPDDRVAFPKLPKGLSWVCTKGGVMDGNVFVRKGEGKIVVMIKFTHADYTEEHQLF